MSSSTYAIPITVNSSFPIAPSTDLLTSDISFVQDEFSPGDSGLVRVWFTLMTDANEDTIVAITHDSFVSASSLFNADNSFVVKSNGLYRFDIPAKFGDLINIRANKELTAIALLRFDKIVFGA